MTESTAITVPADDPGIVLIDQQAYRNWFEGLKAKASSVPVALDTKKGRDALRSIAAEIRSEKAGIKKARLRLTEEWRSLTAQANAAGKVIDEELETLAVVTRAPLTEWEAAEEARVAANTATIDMIRRSSIISPEDTAQMVADRGREIWALAFDEPQWTSEEAAGAVVAKDTAVAALRAAQARLKQEEADRAELARLRQEAVEREAREAADRAERERIEAALLEAEAQEQAERDRAEQIARIQRESAQAEQDRIAAAERAAEDRARAEAEAEAQAARDRVQAAHDAEMAEQRRIAAEAQAARDRLEQDRLASIQRAEEERQVELAELEARRLRQLAADEAERERVANVENRTKVKTGIKLALMTCGADEETARKIVLALIAGEIPRVEVKW